MERELVIIDLLHSLASPLARAYDATRVRTWPIGEAMTVQVWADGRDLEHVNCFIDAVETFHPGSRVNVWLDRPMPKMKIEEAVAAAPGLEVEFYCESKPHKRLSMFPTDLLKAHPPDLSVLMHPYPFMEGADQGALESRRQAYRKFPARRKWTYYRDLELWDGSKAARMSRRALSVLLRPLDAYINRLIDKRLNERVRPRLDAAREWAGNAPCEHTHAFRVLNRPRPIDFCPECGMGLTSPDAIPPAAKLAGIYGEHYALGYRYVGRREYARFQREQVARVAVYIEKLGFEPPQKEGPSILDFGCGGGLYAPLWLERGWRYLGVDFAAGAIENARRNNPSARFAVGGLDAPEVAAGAPYDMIYLSHVLEHVPDPVKLLRELRERSAPGGWIYVEVPNALRATWDLKHRGFANCEHLWDFTPHALEAIAAAAGWQEIRTRPDPSDAYPNLSLLGRNVSV
ncbi:MAG: class I SAM-dependent methyltransferase [Candidatus Sumerlaeia bacterium]